jgi:hypothetical protein
VETLAAPLGSRPAAPSSLYGRIMGAAFRELPPAVRALHGTTAGIRTFGRCDVRRGKNLFSIAIGRILGVPSQADAVALDFEIVARDEGEEWTRRFGPDVMRSRFWGDGDALFERLGPAVMKHCLHVEDGRLHTRLDRLWLMGLPVPRAFLPRIRAVASQDGARYRFDVGAELPVIGLIVSYRGYLDVEAPAA